MTTDRKLALITAGTWMCIYDQLGDMEMIEDVKIVQVQRVFLQAAVFKKCFTKEIKEKRIKRS